MVKRQVVPYTILYYSNYSSKGRGVCGGGKLDIAGCQTKQKDVGLEKVRDKVKYKQNIHKQNADTGRNLKEPVLEPSDFVKLRKPHAIGKGDPQYTPPIKILQVVRPGTYMLADNRIFNQSKLSPVRVDQEQIEVKEKETPVKLLHRPAQKILLLGRMLG